MRGTWPCVHTDKNPVSSGPAVEDSGGRGPASTLTRTPCPHDPLWRFRVDKGPCPHRQEPGFLRTRCGGFGRTWACVPTDKTQSPQDPMWRIQGHVAPCPHGQESVSSGPAVETSGGRVPASTRTRTRFPQDPLWRIQGDVAPRPHGQEPGLLRSRQGRSR